MTNTQQYELSPLFSSLLVVFLITVLTLDTALTGSPRIGSGGGYYGDGGDNDTANTDTGASAAGTDTSALLTGASLCLRLGELISPEDEQLLSGVQQGTSDLLENVRSSKSHADAHNVRLFAAISSTAAPAFALHRFFGY